MVRSGVAGGMAPRSTPGRSGSRAMATAARSPSEKRPGGKAVPGRFLSQLAAALNNPTIKALEWDEDGQGVVVNTKLYDEEGQKHKELFPELKPLRSVSVLQAWLLTSGFKAKAVKADPAVPVFQHADFRKLPPKAGEVDSPLATRQHKKAKKRKSSSDLPASAASTAAALPLDTLRTDRTKSDNPESCSPGTPPQAAVDKSTQVDIDKMLSVCAAHLVPPLSPQYK
ncbi:uncharacterized protein C16orf86 homolog isoform X3 [Lepidochelys kempii]|uniref:uncharacterized protein C16orf86 homolog isoform X3 n=1 Tax=Lepidochelys kempii TaxID=8472 RepID=UPI003C6FD0EC